MVEEKHEGGGIRPPPPGKIGLMTYFISITSLSSLTKQPFQSVMSKTYVVVQMVDI